MTTIMVFVIQDQIVKIGITLSIDLDVFLLGMEGFGHLILNSIRRSIARIKEMRWIVG